MVSKEEATAMTVAVLKQKLAEIGLPVTGKKEDLVTRYVEATASDETTEAAALAAPVVDGAEAQEAPLAENPAVEEEVQPQGGRAKIVFPFEAATKPAEDSVAAAKSAATTAAMSAAEKGKLRAERFKDPEVEKAKARAERFGLPHPEIEKEKVLKRAQRFGTDHPVIEEEKKAMRAKRFGIVDEQVKLEQRAERFKPLTVAKASTVVDSDFEARKKARAERFAA